jgi:hypothetical protein
MKALRTIVVLSVLHFIISFGAFWHSVGSSLGRFDNGKMPSALDRFSDTAVDILWFPFMQIAMATHIGGGSFIEWFLLFANSLLWGVILFGVIRSCRRLLRSRNRNHEHVA